MATTATIRGWEQVPEGCWQKLLQRAVVLAAGRCQTEKNSNSVILNIHIHGFHLKRRGAAVGNKDV